MHALSLSKEDKSCQLLYIKSPAVTGDVYGLVTKCLSADDIVEGGVSTEVVDNDGVNSDCDENISIAEDDFDFDRVSDVASIKSSRLVFKGT